MRRKIIILVGPTAVGKTEYSIELAKRINGEIVSADSMQLYKYMDIGSAKPDDEERKQAVHYLIDEVDPREHFSAFKYMEMAKAAIEKVFSKEKVPIVSGGTGLYVNALMYQMDFSSSPDNSGYRNELEDIVKNEGNQALHDKLAKINLEAAEKIHPNNVKKIIRVLEMLKDGQERVKDFKESFVKTKDYEICLVGLTRQREELYDRINRRVDLLMEKGLLEEIKSLKKMGLTEDNISMKGIGYKELLGYLNGEYDIDEAVRLIKRNTRHYAKRQMTWFKRYDEIKWFELNDSTSKVDIIDDIIEYWKE